MCLIFPHSLCKQNKMASQLFWYICTQTSIPTMPSDYFYASYIRKKRGSKGKLLHKLLRLPKQRVENPYRLLVYTMSFKLRLLVLSYQLFVNILCGFNRFYEPILIEVAKRFRIPVTNLIHWKQKEKEGKFARREGDQSRTVKGGRCQQWLEMKNKPFQRG